MRFVPHDLTRSPSPTLEQAKEIALNHAGQSASNVYFDKVELDHDHGMQKYEIEFITGSTEYDYEIDWLYFRLETVFRLLEYWFRMPVSVSLHQASLFLGPATVILHQDHRSSPKTPESPPENHRRRSGKTAICSSWRSSTASPRGRHS